MLRVTVNAHCIDKSIITWYATKSDQREAKKFVTNKKSWLSNKLGKIITHYTHSIMEVNQGETGKYLSQDPESSEASGE